MSWHGKYSTHSLVYAEFPGGLGLGLILSEHDDRFELVRVHIKNERTTPAGKSRLVADPSKVHFSSLMSSRIIDLSLAQVLSIGVGIDVPKLDLSSVKRELLEEQSKRMPRR